MIFLLIYYKIKKVQKKLNKICNQQMKKIYIFFCNKNMINSYMNYKNNIELLNLKQKMKIIKKLFYKYHNIILIINR